MSGRQRGLGGVLLARDTFGGAVETVLEPSPDTFAAANLGVLVTHQRRLDEIVEAYDLFAHQRDGVLKIAIKP